MSNEELIDRYLNQQLTAEEQAEWDRRMQEEAFVQEVKVQEDAYALTKALGRIELKNRLVKIDAELSKDSSIIQKSKSSPFRFLIWPLAAAALLTLFIIR